MNATTSSKCRRRERPIFGHLSGHPTECQVPEIHEFSRSRRQTLNVLNRDPGKANVYQLDNHIASDHESNYISNDMRPINS